VTRKLSQNFAQCLCPENYQKSQGKTKKGIKLLTDVASFGQGVAAATTRSDRFISELFSILPDALALVVSKSSLSPSSEMALTPHSSSSPMMKLSNSPPT